MLTPVRVSHCSPRSLAATPGVLSHTGDLFVATSPRPYCGTSRSSSACSRRAPKGAALRASDQLRHLRGGAGTRDRRSSAACRLGQSVALAAAASLVCAALIAGLPSAKITGKYFAPTSTAGPQDRRSRRQPAPPRHHGHKTGHAVHHRPIALASLSSARILGTEAADAAADGGTRVCFGSAATATVNIVVVINGVTGAACCD